MGSGCVESMPCVKLVGIDKPTGGDKGKGGWGEAAVTATSGRGCPGAFWGRGRIGRGLVGDTRGGREGSAWAFGGSLSTGKLASRSKEGPTTSPVTVRDVDVPSFVVGVDLPGDRIKGSGGTGPAGRDLAEVNNEAVLLSRKLPVLFAIFKLYDGVGLEGSPLGGFH